MRTQRILRDRIVSMVDRRWEGGLTLAFGGPGMGKSTLVQQAMTENRTLGRGHECLVRCGRGWDAAQLGLGIERALPRNERPPFDHRLLGDAGETVRIAEFFWTLAPQHVGLIIDDVHELDDSGIDYLLDISRQMPSNAHLWIVGRDHPRLVARFMTADPMLVIDEQTLLFDDAEVERFADITGLKTTTLDNAAGWPALLALCASAGDAVANVYLYDSVLAGLSHRQQGDLALAAALGEVDSTLVPEILQGPVGELVAIPLVDALPGGGVSVHELWRDPTAGLIDSQRLDDATRLAASHAEHVGDIDRAASILHQRGLAADARRLMVRDIGAGADRVPLDRIQRWLGLATSPTDGLLRQTLQLIRSGLIEGTIDPERLSALSERCRRAEEFDLEAVLAQVRFAVAWSADDVEACMSIADRLMDLDVPEIMSASQARATKDITVARAELDHERVIERIQTARRELGDVPGLDWNLPLELETLVRLGRPFNALARLEELDEQVATRKVRSVTYGLTYWFCGRPTEAISAIDSLLELPGRFRGIEYSWRSTGQFFRAWSRHGAPEPVRTDRDRSWTNGDAGPASPDASAYAAGSSPGAYAPSAYSQVCHAFSRSQSSSWDGITPSPRKPAV